MNMQLVYTINLVLILNCVTIIAKNDTESEKGKIDTKLNQSIYAEGLSQSPEDEPKRRIYGRKGVIMNVNETTSDETVKSQIDNSVHDVSSQSSSSIVDISSTTSVPFAVHKNDTSNSSSAVINQINQPVLNNSAVSTNLSSTTVSNAPTKSSNTSTSSTVSKKLVISSSEKPTEKTTSSSTTTTTAKPKKPQITYSADDDPQIRDSEKNINYNVANEKSDELPKVEQDIDRTMIDEKRARNSYMLYLGLVFALPTSFVLINIAYRRIKSYLELRHYTRVDFLVDGMYVS